MQSICAEANTLYKYQQEIEKERFIVLIEYEEMNRVNKEKIDYIYNSLLATIKKNACNFCLGPANIACKKCGDIFYCCEAHEEKEWIINHFFECKIYQFFKMLFKVETSSITSNYPSISYIK